MKKSLYIALAAAAMSLGAVSAASAAVPANANHGNAVRHAVAPLQLVDSVDWRHHRRHCVWRHHRRVCWWD